VEKLNLVLYVENIFLLKGSIKELVSAYLRLPILLEFLEVENMSLAIFWQCIY
jgi:hypothetical protein